MLHKIITLAGLICVLSPAAFADNACSNFSGTYKYADAESPSRFTIVTIRQTDCESIELFGKDLATDGVERIEWSSGSTQVFTKWEHNGPLLINTSTVRWSNRVYPLVQTSKMSLLANGDIQEQVVRTGYIECSGDACTPDYPKLVTHDWNLRHQKVNPQL